MHLFALALLFATPRALAGGSPSLAVGYYGDIISHPGGYAGLSWELAEAGVFSFHAGADLGAYHHRRNHTGAFLRGNLSTRVTSGSGFFVEPRYFMGYLHTWVAGDQYWVVDSVTGQVREVVDAGTPNVTLGFGLGLGVELDAGPAIVVRPQIAGRAPYNDFVLSQFALQVGVEWPLGRGAK